MTIRMSTLRNLANAGRLGRRVGRALLFCAWLAWCRHRVVIPTGARPGVLRLWSRHRRAGWYGEFPRAACAAGGTLDWYSSRGSEGPGPLTIRQPAAGHGANARNDEETP